MNADAWLTLAVLVVTFAVLVRDRFPPAGVVLAADIALLLADVISVDQAFAGFSNPAPITVAALFVVAAGAQSTGLLSGALPRLLQGGGPRRSLARLLAPTAAASGLMNNTPLVAILIPDIVAWCRRNHRSPSRYLLPLSYAAILGGTLTVLGTSTNLVVSGLLQERTGEGLHIFELTPVGLPVVIIGLAVLVFVSAPLIAERRSAADQVTDEAPEFTVEMCVDERGPMDGSSVEGAGLRHLSGVFLVEIERAGRRVAPVAPDEVLVGGDVLVFAGQTDDVLDLQRLPGLSPISEVADLAEPGRGLYEVVVGRMSPVAGQCIRDADFRSRYGAAVLAVHRAGQRVTGKLGDVRLRHGDTLIVVAGRGFRRQWARRPDFLVVAELDAAPPVVGARAPIVGLAIVGFVVLSSVGVLSTLEGALVAAGALIATRVVTFDEAKRSVDVDVILLIGAAFGLGAAVEASGLSDEVARSFVSAFDGLGTFGLILGIVLATALLTEIVTNNAAAVVVFPIAFDVAESAQLDVHAVAIAVALAASTSFLSPIGYQTNTMVYGPGGYRFGDYLRAGAPLSISVIVTITTATTLIA